MANTPSRTPLIAALGVAIGAVLMLNVMAQRINPAEQKRMEQEREQKQQQEAAKNATPQPVAPPATGGNSQLVLLGDDTTIGPPNGQPQVTVSYEWTPDVQASPSLVYDAVQGLQQRMAGARIRVVNRDAHPEAPAPGVYMGTNLLVGAGPNGSIKLPAAMPSMPVSSATPKAAATSPALVPRSGTVTGAAGGGGTGDLSGTPTAAPSASPTPGAVISAPDR